MSAARRRWWKRKPAPVHTCEVCGCEGVERRGDWDYCARGHIYVGKRASDIPPGDLWDHAPRNYAEQRALLEDSLRDIPHQEN